MWITNWLSLSLKSKSELLQSRKPLWNQHKLLKMFLKQNKVFKKSLENENYINDLSNFLFRFYSFNKIMWVFKTFNKIWEITLEKLNKITFHEHRVASAEANMLPSILCMWLWKFSSTRLRLFFSAFFSINLTICRCCRCFFRVCGFACNVIRKSIETAQLLSHWAFDRRQMSVEVK